MVVEGVGVETAQRVATILTHSRHIDARRISNQTDILFDCYKISMTIINLTKTKMYPLGDEFLSDHDFRLMRGPVKIVLMSYPLSSTLAISVRVRSPDDSSTQGLHHVYCN